jgi:hypothetical protein
MAFQSDRTPARLSPAQRDQRAIELTIERDPEALRRFARRTGMTPEAIRARARKLGLTPQIARNARLAGTRPALRECLRCDVEFMSRGRHNRLCSRCARKRH